MNLPKKCGNVYIKFDENNDPEYGFEIESYSGKKYTKKWIKKFIIMTEKKIDTIVLPKLFKEGEHINVEKITSKDWANSFFLLFDKYVTGEVKLCEGCFAGIKEAKIIVPFTSSIMIDYGSFDKDANIEFITNPSLRLKQVYRRFDTGFDYEHENWTLIADKSFNYGGNMFGDYFYVEDYNENNIDYKVANLKLKNKNISIEHKDEKAF